MKDHIFILIAFVLGGLMMALPPMLSDSETESKAVQITIKSKLIDEKELDNNGGHGWQMHCNYTGGSNADWDEETQKYGEQKYLDCANGLVYEKIGQSTSITYFNPNDKETNEKYCKKGEVARFSYEDPISGLGHGDFVGCFNF